MEIKEVKLEIINLIAKDELNKAVKMLQENVPMNHPNYVSLVMQMRRLNDLKTKTTNATIAFDEANMERNKISQSLIEMTQSLSKPTSPPPSSIAETTLDTPSPQQPPKYQDDLLDDDDDDVHEDKFYDDELDVQFTPSLNQLQGYQNQIVYQGSPAMEEQTIVLNQTYDMTFLRCVQAINYNGFTMKEQNQTMGYIQATSGISIWSFGEGLHIYLRELEGYKTNVHIICDSVVKNTITSWGKNSKNINKIITILKQV